MLEMLQLKIYLTRGKGVNVFTDPHLSYSGRGPNSYLSRRTEISHGRISGMSYFHHRGDFRLVGPDPDLKYIARGCY